MASILIIYIGDVLYFLLVPLIVFLLLGCDARHVDSHIRLSDELSLMTGEERIARSPNRAFDGVWLRSVNEVRAILDQDRSLFLTRNSDGSTPLMLAIQLREIEISQLIIESLTQSELLVTDNNGRGYISYAAEQGFIILLESMVDKYRQSMQFPSLFRMSQLDVVDDLGRISLFYAANSATAQRLKEFWMQWPGSRIVSRTWLSNFYQTRDGSRQIFLHSAAADNRHDTLRWAILETCGDAIWSDSEFLFGGLTHIGSALDWLAGAIQVVPIIPSDLVNVVDNSSNTPLHIAVRGGHYESARALLSCRNTRYSILNNFGRTPLAELLAHIDPNLSSVPNSFKQIFDALTQMQNRYRVWWRTIQDIVNTQDNDGRSALHYAARLRDPYFYNKLKEFGDVYLMDNQDMTPEGIFNSRQR
jgi:ankyrin repeat protein